MIIGDSKQAYCKSPSVFNMLFAELLKWLFINPYVSMSVYVYKLL